MSQEMHDMTRETLDAGGYDLGFMLLQIDRLWLEGGIDATERDVLKEYAREHATPEDSYAPVEQRVLQLETALVALEARVAALEESGGDQPTPEPSDEWPEFVQPTGAHDAYNTGDKVTYKSRHYVCQMDGCVWSPAVLPSAWQDMGEVPSDIEETEGGGE